MTHSLAAHHTIVERALRDLLQTYETFFTKDDLYDATEYLDNGEYGLALESLAYVVMHSGKTPLQPAPRYLKPMTLDEIAATTDADIDFSDIPDLSDVEPMELRYMGLAPLRREGYPIVNDEYLSNFTIPREHPLAIAAHHGWPDHTPEQAREAVRLYVEKLGQNS